MGRRRRHSAVPPVMPPLLLMLLYLATPFVNAVNPRPVRGTLVQRLVGQRELDLQSDRHGSVNGRRQETAEFPQLYMELGLDDEGDDVDEGSGSLSTFPPHVTSLTLPATHRLRHDRGHSSDQLVDRRPQEIAAPSTQLLPGVRLSTPQPASHAPAMPVGISQPVSAPSPPPSPPSPPPSPPRRRLRPHDACYSSNEVLLVVGVTCAVNFAFILVVVALVHLCNRGAAKVVPAAFEYEPQADGECRGRVAAAGGAGAVDLSGGGDATCVYSRVQEYVDSLPDALSPFHREDEDEGAEGEEAAARGGGGGEGGGGDDAGLVGGRASRRRSAHGLHSAFSMEQLLFVD